MTLSPPELEKKVINDFPGIEDLEEWPLVRLRIYFEYFKKINNFKVRDSLFKKISQKIYILRSTLYGLPNIFKSYEVFVFSDTGEYQLIEGKYTDKLFYPLFKIIGAKRMLYIEKSHKDIPHKKKKLSGNPNPISASFFHITAKLLILFSFKNQKKILQLESKLLEKYNLNLDLNKEIKYLYIYKKIFFYFLRWKKPKAIFLCSYYNSFSMGLIAAAKELGIQTVEQQHGMTHKKNPPYNLFGKKDMPKTFYPDYFLSFSPKITLESNGDFFIKETNTFACGHPYLDFLSSKTTKKKSEPIIGVTLQWPYEEDTLSFIFQAAPLLPKAKIVIIPRNPHLKKYSLIKCPPNVTIEQHKNFYTLITKDINIHCTVNSTTALEALYFGVPNIFIDLNKKASLYYGSTLKKDLVNQYVQNTNDFKKSVHLAQNIDQNDIQKISEELFSKDYHKNLQLFIENKLSFLLRN